MAEQMSKEQAAAFDKVMRGALDALDVFQRTGERKQFAAVQDQIASYQKEFGSVFKMKFDGVELGG